MPGIVYFTAVNLLAFSVFGYDKYKACRGKRRVPEKRLLFLTCIGGSIGAWCGMFLFRHKIRKIKFAAGIPAIFAAQCVICWLLSLDS